MSIETLVPGIDVDSASYDPSAESQPQDDPGNMLPYSDPFETDCGWVVFDFGADLDPKEARSLGLSGNGDSRCKENSVATFAHDSLNVWIKFAHRDDYLKSA